MIGALLFRFLFTRRCIVIHSLVVNQSVFGYFLVVEVGEEGKVLPFICDLLLINAIVREGTALSFSALFTRFR